MTDQRAVLWRCKNGRWQPSGLHEPGDPRELTRLAEQYNREVVGNVRYAVFPEGVDPSAP